MARKKSLQEIRLPSFGSVIGLVFEHGGAAEVLMTFPELHYLLDAWRDHEEAKSRPDKKTIAALKVLHRKAWHFRPRMVAEVPIAQQRAKITPVLE